MYYVTDRQAPTLVDIYCTVGCSHQEASRLNSKSNPTIKSDLEYSKIQLTTPVFSFTAAIIYWFSFLEIDKIYTVMLTGYGD